MRSTGINRLYFGLTAVCFVMIGLDPVLGVQADPPIRGDFVVAPTGDDGNPGTLERPFRSLAKVRDAGRALKREQPAQPVTVLIRGGTYDQHESIVFSGRDSSKGDYRLRPESPALKLGFKPIPFDKIGVQGVEALK